MSNVKNYSYVGRGQLHVRAVGTADPLQPLGNASALKLSIAESKVEQKNYMTVGGGIRDSISRVDSAEVEISLYDLSPLTLAMALRATRSEHAAGSVTDESATAVYGLIETEKLPDESSIIVTDDTGSTVYVRGADYTVSGAGIEIVEGGSITEGSALKLNYDVLPSVQLEALAASGVEFYGVFTGLNEARGGSPVNVRLFRLKFSPTDGLDLISDEYGQITLKGSILADTSRPAGTSQYFSVAMAQA